MHIFGTDYPTKDGSCVRDYVHVVDIAKAHILALSNLDKFCGHTYNLGSGEGYTVLEVMGIKLEQEAVKPKPLPSCPPLRVLVAEDGIANQHVAVGLLQAGGHRAVVVSDGRETIARWQSEPFDLILMDMHMPIMDGIEATRQIRAAERATGGHIPIIALTAASTIEASISIQTTS